MMATTFPTRNLSAGRRPTSGLSTRRPVNLLVEERKIRFGINMDAADRAGLKISSKLLRQAKSVHERRKG
jgi:hypothetical protein